MDQTEIGSVDSIDARLDEAMHNIKEIKGELTATRIRWEALLDSISRRAGDDSTR